MSGTRARRVHDAIEKLIGFVFGTYRTEPPFRTGAQLGRSGLSFVIGYRGIYIFRHSTRRSRWTWTCLISVALAGWTAINVHRSGAPVWACVVVVFVYIAAAFSLHAFNERQRDIRDRALERIAIVTARIDMAAERTARAQERMRAALGDDRD
jgi:hypothetical protein